MKKLKLVSNISAVDFVKRVSSGETFYGDQTGDVEIRKTGNDNVGMFVNGLFQKIYQIKLGGESLYVEVEPEWYETINFPALVLRNDKEVAVVTQFANGEFKLASDGEWESVDRYIGVIANEEIKQFLQPESESDYGRWEDSLSKGVQCYVGDDSLGECISDGVVSNVFVFLPDRSSPYIASNGNKYRYAVPVNPALRNKEGV